MITPILEQDVILQKGMVPTAMQASRFQMLQILSTLAGLGAAGEERHMNGQPLAPFFHGLVLLLGEDFRGGQETAWCPDSTAVSMAMNATNVLPLPTSPCKRRTIFFSCAVWKISLRTVS